jgi:hypothetical protein
MLTNSWRITDTDFTEEEYTDVYADQLELLVFNYHRAIPRVLSSSSVNKYKRSTNR